MKIALAFCILLVTCVVCLQAAPVKNGWYNLLHGITLKKGPVGDIWSNCGKEGDHAKISNVIITPDPPVKGDNIEVKATITLDEEVTGGEVKVNLNYGDIPIYSTTLDLCDILEQLTSDSCPLSKGAHDIDIKQTIPGFAPGGKYKGKAVATDQNGAELACIDVNLTL